MTALVLWNHWNPSNWLWTYYSSTIGEHVNFINLCLFFSPFFYSMCLHQIWNFLHMPNGTLLCFDLIRLDQKRKKIKIKIDGSKWIVRLIKVSHWCGNILNLFSYRFRVYIFRFCWFEKIHMTHIKTICTVNRYENRREFLFETIMKFKIHFSPSTYYFSQDK